MALKKINDITKAIKNLDPIVRISNKFLSFTLLFNLFIIFFVSVLFPSINPNILHVNISDDICFIINQGPLARAVNQIFDRHMPTNQSVIFSFFLSHSAFFPISYNFILFLPVCQITLTISQLIVVIIPLLK